MVQCSSECSESASDCTDCGAGASFVDLGPLAGCGTSLGGVHPLSGTESAGSRCRSFRSSIAFCRKRRNAVEARSQIMKLKSLQGILLGLKAGSFAALIDFDRQVEVLRVQPLSSPNAA